MEAKFRLQGNSMLPIIRDGDSVEVTVMQGKNLEDFTIGDILLVRAQGEWVAHRLVEQKNLRFLKGDRAKLFDSKSDTQVWGLVIGLSRKGQSITWGPAGHFAKSLFAWLSSKCGSTYEKPVSRFRRLVFLLPLLAIGQLLTPIIWTRRNG